MKTITAKEFYSGTDPETGQDFTLEAGDSIEVSDEKVEQLKRDGLDERFAIGKAGSKKAAKQSGDDGGDGEPGADLKGKKRPELEQIATEIGVKDPDKIDTVEKLRRAIVSAREGQEGAEAPDDVRGQQVAGE